MPNSIFAAINPVDFFGARSYSDGYSRYYTIESGDFDGDGKLDILTVNGLNILIFYGDGSGKYLTEPLVIRNDFGYIPITGDFNRDGRTDLAVSPTNSITVYFGNANKTVSSPINTALESTISSIVAVDYDGDGKLDILGTNSLNILFYKGNDQGSFTKSGELAATISIQPRDLTIDDFNNDNLPDVAYSDIDNLYVSKNTGNGGFGPRTAVANASLGFISIAIGDLSNDGKKDLVTTNYAFSNPAVKILLGNGDFTFSDGGSFIIPSHEEVYIQKIADLNNDQKQDLIFGSQNRILVRKGNGNGTFSPVQEYLDGSAAFDIKDVDSDGFPDIISCNSSRFAVLGSGSFSILENLHDGNFASAPGIDTGFGTNDIAVADLNADQLKDIVIVNRGGDVVLIFQNALRKIRKIFGNTKSLNGSINMDTSSVTIADFNQDTKPDVMIGGRATSAQNLNGFLLTNLGNGNFSPTLFKLSTEEIYEIASADFNADGKIDLVTAGFQGVNISFGIGNGTFANPVKYFDTIASNDVAISDFNGDGKPDIAVSNYNQRKAGVLINSGTGTFTSAQYSLTGAPSKIAIADMNLDGKNDLIISVNTGISVLLGNNSGTFANEVVYPIKPSSAAGLAVADFNNDGKPDVASLGGTNVLSVLLNNGSGGLGNETLWGAGVELTAIAASDLDADQKSDVVLGFTTSSDGYIKVLFNSTVNTPTASKFIDFDGDGKTDISIYRPSLGQWWYLRSSDNANRAFSFGTSTDKIVPADYTGDGKTDIATFTPSTGFWSVLRSEDSTYYAYPFGSTGDIPVPADFDGDGKADSAVFRPSTQIWYISKSSGGTTITPFGTSGDVPAVGDYDGDGKTDIGIYRVALGQWWYLRSSDNTNRVFTFGTSTDKIVQGDYTGDGKTDIAFYRPSTGFWYILRSEDSSFYAFPFGSTGDIPVSGDYDGDGKFDAAVFRPSGNTWYLNRSTSGVGIIGFGTTGDQPVPNAFVP